MFIWGLLNVFGRFPILVKTAIRLSRRASILLDTHAMCSVEICSCQCAIVRVWVFVDVIGALAWILCDIHPLGSNWTSV